MADGFRGWVIEKAEKGTTASLRDDLSDSDLPEGDVLVDVDYSTINYKDALAITGKGKIIRTFPCSPGIDFAGTVAVSDDPAYKPGDHVVLNGWGVGESHSGGLAQRARVKGKWLVALPEAFDTKQAMAIGTAGYTAMLSVLALEEQGVAKGSEVVVTGSAGGVGSIALALLAAAGFKPVAVSGRPELEPYLKEMGAVEVLPRSAFSEGSKAPLDSGRWAGAIDSVGSTTLANVLKAMAYGGTVAACGLAGGHELPTTVFPFILRGVKLVGIDSVYKPKPAREVAWKRLGELLPAAKLEAAMNVVPLADALPVSSSMLEGQVRGRTVVDVNG